MHSHGPGKKPPDSLGQKLQNKQYLNNSASRQTDTPPWALRQAKWSLPPNRLGPFLLGQKPTAKRLPWAFSALAAGNPEPYCNTLEIHALRAVDHTSVEPNGVACGEPEYP